MSVAQPVDLTSRAPGALALGTARARPGDTSENEPNLPKVRPSLALGVIVVLGIMLLQLTTEMVAGREAPRIVARLSIMALELPLLMLALSAAFGWSLRHRVSATRGVLLGVAIATGIGCAFGLLYAAIAARFPQLKMHVSGGAVHLRAILFGVLNAQLYYGLWALAFVYPFAVESAGLRALEAKNLRSQAEVARLRAHLEPHFLLNTLNAIAGLVTEEPREARRLIACLGELLRDAVQETGERQRIDTQVAWLRRYAQILEARHHGALRFRWEIAPECEAVLLPRLLLQPLVENAVKHGALRRRDGAGEVVVQVLRRPEGGLVCAVQDNGPGMPDADVRAGAFGLQAVRRRLELELPGAHLYHESSGGGTRSVIELQT
jgi:signal transduction histidine kinase